MDWDKLRIFQATVEAGSFTHAGETLGMSQSAVSRQISALEQEMGVALFHRHARGLLLTEQGEMLAATTRKVDLQIEQARTDLIDSKNRPTGELRVTTTIGLGSNWLVPNLDGFFDLYPGIDLSVTLSDDELDIGMRQADVALRLRQPMQPDLIQRKLFDVHLHVYASTSYIERFGQPRSLEDLDEHRIISFGPGAPAYLLQEMSWIEDAGRAPGAPPRRIVLKVNNITALYRAVARGHGIALLPDYTVGGEAKLVRLLTDYELPSFECFFVYPSEMRHSARVGAFRDFLLSKARRWRH